jgi:FkbM family methyltransferase
MKSLVSRVISAAGYQPRGIVHVGAHVAEEMELYLELGPALIVWVEADPAQAMRLGSAIRRRQAPIRQIAVEALIADVDGREFDFHRFSNKGQSSSVFRATSALYDHWPDVRETGEVLRLTSSRLDTALRGASVSPDEIDVLVLDIQGAELMALAGAGDYLGHAEFVETEVSQEEIYQGAPQADAVEAALAEHGFRRLTGLPWHGSVAYRRQS